ncbi:hypothetical protein BCR43DRAFT_168231 [Syncephalastrum racemosum]|uniref:Ubiquitin-like domain-containing protein n=1 Tax=Syncephalastrum racemosum TaxID=13706 RepID=A0A1X2HP55_SYNRA|nr:hypothetical protein BCR43DRAFT_168231 [Syncephalastrum racemosum]
MPPDADDYYESFDLHIRFTEGQDLVVRVSPEDSVAAIKEKIKQTEIERTRNKNIRLIYSARILDDGRQLRDYGMGKLTVSDSKAKMPPAPPVYVHCSLSEYQPRSHTNVCNAVISFYAFQEIIDACRIDEFG